MSLKDFLRNQEWAVYQVDGLKRKYFGDTFFGPMWKNFPEELDVPSDLKLNNLIEVKEYIKE